MSNTTTSILNHLRIAAVVLAGLQPIGSPVLAQEAPLLRWQGPQEQSEWTSVRVGEGLRQGAGVGGDAAPGWQPDFAVQGDFPPLPPHPYADQRPPLPPLDGELWQHGGSYLYQPEGDRLNWPGEDAHFDLLRLPEDWRAPEPYTLFSDFVGADPIRTYPRLHWPGSRGYYWEPRLVAYGAYQWFGFALEQNNRRQDVLGHNLFLDLDLQLTGTERFHMQLRPLGGRNPGGSFYQFNDPDGYVDNSELEPQRFWFEAELHSLLGAFVDPFAALDYNLVVGKFPFAIHNALLINDEITGVVLSKNTTYFWHLSNLNTQVFYAFNDVDTFPGQEATFLGAHVTAEHRRNLYEWTTAYVNVDGPLNRDTWYAGVSRSGFYGQLTVATRALFKWGDEAGAGSGQLYSLECNYTRIPEHEFLGIESAVLFGNVFYVTDGWSSLGQGNFNRLRTAFEVNPLVRIATSAANVDTFGVALGTQLFRCHDDESWIPEVAFETPQGTPVWGVGLKYQRKTSRRSFLEALGVFNFSDDPRFDREGAFVSHTLLF